MTLKLMARQFFPEMCEYKSSARKTRRMVSIPTVKQLPIAQPEARSTSQLSDLGIWIYLISEYAMPKRPFLCLPSLVETHTVSSRLLILHHVEIISRQPKRFQKAVTELLQFAHHIRHLALLRFFQLWWESPERDLYGFEIEGRKIGGLGEL